MEDLQELFQEISAAKQRHYGQEAPWPRRNPIASDIGPCGRETALSILHWQERPAPSPELKARFEMGNECEARVMRQLSLMGFQVVEQQGPFELRDKAGRVILSGKIDGKIRFRGERIPFDVKSSDPRAFDRLHELLCAPECLAG